MYVINYCFDTRNGSGIEAAIPFCLVHVFNHQQNKMIYSILITCNDILSYLCDDDNSDE